MAASSRLGGGGFSARNGELRDRTCGIVRSVRYG